AIFPLVFVELDQVPIVPPRFPHGLVAVIENGRTERQVVPFQASDFAGFASDAGRGVDQLADGVLPLGVLAGDGSGMRGNFLDAPCLLAHGCAYAFSILTKKPLNSGVYALGSITVGVSKFAGVLAVLPSSSAMPR